jgi:YegS/Rv2252/BmrU family lipid kinase
VGGGGVQPGPAVDGRRASARAADAAAYDAPLTAPRIDSVLLVVNPAARRGAGAQAAAVRAFAAAGVRCDTVLTERAGHGGEIAAARHAAYDAVFTLGGDGTAMEVVGALANSHRPVGILPGGTGNLVARTLGVPLSVPRAVPALLGGKQADVDLGRLTGGRCFAFAAGVGVDARMIDETPAALKRRLGVSAYVLYAARAVLGRQEFTVRATIDGEVIERRASAVMIVNFGAVLNDLLRLGPGIAEDDGHLDLCVFSPRHLRDSVRIMWRLVRKDFRDDPCVLYRAGRTFVVETEPPRAAQADGELLGATPFAVQVEPRAARLLVPRRP